MLETIERDNTTEERHLTDQQPIENTMMKEGASRFTQSNESPLRKPPLKNCTLSALCGGGTWKSFGADISRHSLTDTS